MIRAGDLDRRITFQRRAVVDDGFASRPGEPAEIAKVWAKVTPISDGEKFGGGAVRATVDTRFLVRWSSATAAITEKDSIAYDGRVFGIVGLPKEIGRREGLEFSATAQA